ncbi:MAG: hypothetical protein A3G25_05500 [Betaproteobacteria bacterium RIFCSPLOWO2_12_FULL_63_13]|nr:MAG: hypothetical protein A3H32_11540 [Betaproteobacteria bacterium RIFCSPLOWO2_02_FULL_63_19]OGA43090.1 MAG: hypothetical protein A3G25_05500 [Betaproteobacteria bacterium RIFCSPLOWO2_12_FULL_63_13]
MNKALLLATLLFPLSFCLATVESSFAQTYDFSYSYYDPSASGADDHIVSVSNAVLHGEGNVTAWIPKAGALTYEGTTPGVITYRFDFQGTVADATLSIATSTFHWSYSEGHAFVYGSRDGETWVELSETVPPEFGLANTQVARSLPASLFGGQSLWFKVELYSYGESAAQGGVWTNTAQHSRYDGTANNKTFELNVRFAASAGTTVAPATPLPPAPTTQTVFTLPTGEMPADAVSVSPSGTFGSATLVVALDLSKVLTGGSSAAQGRFAATYNIYVAALVPGGVLGLSDATWFVYPATHAWAELASTIDAYLEGIAENAIDTREISILQDMDVTGLVGSEIYIGYGTSDAEMLNANRYRGIYKVQ